MKKCKKCGVEKSFGSFYKHREMSGGCAEFTTVLGIKKTKLYTLFKEK